MRDMILGNIANMSLGALMFAISYISNICFSIFYNIKILNYKFEKEKLIDGILKLITFIIGTFLLCLGISILPLFLDKTGISISEEYTSILSNTAIVGLFTANSAKYLLESFNTMKSILEKKKNDS